MAFFQALCILTGLIFAAKPALDFAEQQLYRWHSQKLWWQRDPSAEPVPGKPFAWVQSRDIGLEDVVLYGERNPASMAHPSLSVYGREPGETDGLFIIEGHRHSHFPQLEKMKIGQSLSLETVSGNIQKYILTEIEILALNQLPRSLEKNDGDRALVLMTGYPFHYLGLPPLRFLAWFKKAPELTFLVGKKLSEPAYLNRSF